MARFRSLVVAVVIVVVSGAVGMLGSAVIWPSAGVMILMALLAGLALRWAAKSRGWL